MPKRRHINYAYYRLSKLLETPNESSVTFHLQPVKGWLAVSCIFPDRLESEGWPSCASSDVPGPAFTGRRNRNILTSHRPSYIGFPSEDLICVPSCDGQRAKWRAKNEKIEKFSAPRLQKTWYSDPPALWSLTKKIKWAQLRRKLSTLNDLKIIVSKIVLKILTAKEE